MLQSQIDYLKEDYENLKRQVAELQGKLNKACIPKLPWDKAPTWACWAAMDLDQFWWWYENEPTRRMSTWNQSDYSMRALAFDAPPCVDWQESKQARP